MEHDMKIYYKISETDKYKGFSDPCATSHTEIEFEDVLTVELLAGGKRVNKFTCSSENREIYVVLRNGKEDSRMYVDDDDLAVSEHYRQAMLEFEIEFEPADFGGGSPSEEGYYYFVDRKGTVLRTKGEPDPNYFGEFVAYRDGYRYSYKPTDVVRAATAAEYAGTDATPAVERDDFFSLRTEE